MPFLDTSDVLCDPDFCDMTMTYTRSVVVANDQGIGVATTKTLPLFGVVTSDSGDVLKRVPVGEYVEGSILICTRTKLIEAAKGYTADIITWDGNQYTVAKVNGYSTYGVGFVEAICELIPLSGGA